MSLLNDDYWENRWQQQSTGWDIGYASPALCSYANQYSNKQAAVLIPGCGNGWEAIQLAADGFTNITLLDIAPTAVQQQQQRLAHLPQLSMVCGDFFEHETKYDLLLEQTFFCALPPALRPQYVKHAAHLLRPGGTMAGVLFNRQFEAAGPPFGGDENEYRTLFSEHFLLHTFAPCYNSIPQRQGTELFFIAKKQ